jgi:hypothetical protein
MIRMKQILSETQQEENYRKLNSKQKHLIIDAVNKFNKFEQHIYRQKDVKEIVEAIKIISEYAGKLALDETGDWFDGVTVKKDVKDINDSVTLFEKTAKEVGTLQHRLEAMYENIGGKLSRYYEIADVDRTIPIAPKNANTSPDNIKKDVKSIAEAYRTRISVPRFVKDKKNPNFLNVYIDYDLGPGGSPIALGKETMTGQIRRESAAKAMKLAGDVARDLKRKYNLEDIEISDLKNGKVRVFAVSDDFISEAKGLSEAVNVNYWKGYHERSTKLTGGNKVASAVENEVRDWNKNNTDGPSNNISSNGERKVMNLAHDFFKSAGWISSDIIQAMITQEG